MAKQGKRRTFSICLTDIPKERILIHENGKKYLNLESWDNDEPDKYDNDFSVRICLNKEEIEKKKNNEEVKSIYLGNGRIWESVSKIREATAEDVAAMEEDLTGYPSKINITINSKPTLNRVGFFCFSKNKLKKYLKTFHL